MKCDEIPLPELMRGDPLPEETAARVQAHIESCTRCQERARVMAIFETSRPTVVAAAPPRFGWFAVAASVLLVCALVILLQNFGPDAPGRRAAGFATDRPYPHVGLTVRGDDRNLQEKSRLEAFSAYERGDYAQAVRTFTNLEMTPEIRFYLGVSLYLSKDPEAAVPYLADASKTEPWHAPAQWYLANALLEQEDIEGARKHLENLVREDGEFKDRARSLLKNLEGMTGGEP